MIGSAKENNKHQTTKRQQTVTSSRWQPDYYLVNPVSPPCFACASRGGYLCAGMLLATAECSREASPLFHSLSPPLLSLWKCTEVKKKKKKEEASTRSRACAYYYFFSFFPPFHPQSRTRAIVSPLPNCAREAHLQLCLARANRLVSGLIRGARSNNAAWKKKKKQQFELSTSYLAAY